MICVTLDGFVRNRSGNPIPDGLKILAMLCEQYRVAVLTDDLAAAGKRWVEQRNVPTEPAMVIGSDLAVRRDSILRLDQVDYARTLGPVEFVVDPDPMVIAECMRRGVPGLLYTSPPYSRPEFRPDAPPPRSWDEIQRVLDEQEDLRLKDKRLDQERDQRFGD